MMQGQTPADVATVDARGTHSTGTAGWPDWSILKKPPYCVLTSIIASENSAIRLRLLSLIQVSST